jgi:predicted DCC family thiol-disulfide oxidoreductase YuxK
MVKADRPDTSPRSGPIVFFDGVCGLCNRSVDLLLRWDRRHVLRFAPLQGSTAAQLLPPDRIIDLDSFVLIDDAGMHIRSTAVLRALEQVGGPWRAVVLLRVVPGFVRDAVYSWVARNRYRWYGQRAQCRLPTRQEAARFLP